MSSKLVCPHWLPLRHEPFHALRYRTQVTAHHWTEDQNSKKVLQPSNASKRSWPHADCQVAGPRWSRGNPPTDMGGRFARRADVEVVADTVDPMSESPLIHPAASVVNFVARRSPRPLRYRVVLTKWMHVLKVPRRCDHGPDHFSRSGNLASHSNWSFSLRAVSHHSIIADDGSRLR